MRLVKHLRRGISRLTRKKSTDGRDIQEERKHILTAKSDFYTKEAYKTLRTNVTFSLTTEGCRVIAVTSAMASEGKSITVLNLAISFAEAGQRVLLMDCDLRRPNQARLLDMKPKPGMSNVLVKMADTKGAIQKTKHKGLDVLLSGDIPPNPSELIGSERMGKMLGELKEQYDYIFIDTPPVNVVADTSVLSKYVDGLLFVVRQRESEKDSVLSAVSQMEFANAKLLGFILNGVRADGSGRYGYGKYKKYKKYKKYGRYGYGRGYGYGYGYSREPEEQGEDDAPGGTE